MSTRTMPSTAPSRRRSAGLPVTVAVAAATLLGGWQAWAVYHPAPPAGLHVGGVVYSVQHSEQVPGLSDADLSGMSHGIPDLVTDDKAMVRVSVAVLAGGAATPFDPGVLYLDDGRGGKPIAPVGGTLAPGRLDAGASIDGALTFVVPRSGEHLTLHAPGDPGSVEVLTVDKAPPGAGAHSHGAAPTAQADPNAADPSAADPNANSPFSLDPVDPSGGTVPQTPKK